MNSCEASITNLATAPNKAINPPGASGARGVLPALARHRDWPWFASKSCRRCGCLAGSTYCTSRLTTPLQNVTLAPPTCLPGTPSWSTALDPSSMARMVGMGPRAASSPTQENGRPTLLGGRSEGHATKGHGLHKRPCCRTLRDPDSTQARSVGRDCGARS